VKRVVVPVAARPALNHLIPGVSGVLKLVGKVERLDICQAVDAALLAGVDPPQQASECSVVVGHRLVLVVAGRDVAYLTPAAIEDGRNGVKVEAEPAGRIGAEHLAGPGVGESVKPET
jgi:hypothetical protein